METCIISLPTAEQKETAYGQRTADTITTVFGVQIVRNSRCASLPVPFAGYFPKIGTGIRLQPAQIPGHSPGKGCAGLRTKVFEPAG
jgi:hypothetical protein